MINHLKMLHSSGACSKKCLFQKRKKYFLDVLFFKKLKSRNIPVEKEISPETGKSSDSFHFQVRLIRLNFRLILILGEDLGELGEYLGEKGSILGELGFRLNSPKSKTFSPSRLG